MNSPSDSRKKIVVVIDDDPQMREIISASLAGMRLAIIEASTAEEAVSKASNYVIDIAIVDVFMPGKGGLWVIEQLKTQHKNLKVISMSGGWGQMPPEKAIKAADKIGADFVLTKPFDIIELQNNVKSLLE